MTTLAPSFPAKVSARQTDEILGYVFAVSWWEWWGGGVRG